MTTLVSTLGFDTSHLYSLLVDQGVEAGDHLVLVRPDDDDERGDEAVQQIEDMVTKVDPDISTELVEIDPEGFDEASIQLAKTLNRYDDEVVVNLAGGDRMLMLALAIATMSSTADIEDTYVRSDVTRNTERVTLPDLETELDGSHEEVLNYILENAPVSNTRIAAANGLSEASVSRCVRDLESKGYVEVEDSGGSNSIQPDFLGLLHKQRD